MTRRWEDALEAQLDLFKSVQTPAGRRYNEGFGKSIGNAETGGGHSSALRRWFYADLADAIPHILWRADPIHIDPDMYTLVEAAYPQFQPEPLHQTDLFIPAGFAALPRPWYIVDRAGFNIAIRYVAWYPLRTGRIHKDGQMPFPESTMMLCESPNEIEVAKGLMVALFSDINDPDDFTSVNDDLYKASGLRVVLSHVGPWWFDEPYPNTEAGRSMAGIAQFVQTLWRLMNQTITVKEQRRPDRSTRKRVAKVGFPDKSVTVICLRRPRHDPDPDREVRQVDWDHRWIVSGHWRWQPYRDGVKRQIWISPYVKGPEDKPLEVRKLRVFEFVR